MVFRNGKIRGVLRRLLYVPRIYLFVTLHESVMSVPDVDEFHSVHESEVTDEDWHGFHSWVVVGV